MTERPNYLSRLARIGALVGALLLMATFASSAEAASPRFDVKATWGDTNLTPGGEGQFEVQFRNIGDADAAETEFTITEELPAGVEVTNIEWNGYFGDLSFLCSGVGTNTATCNIPSFFGFVTPLLAPARGTSGNFVTVEPTGYVMPLFIDVAIAPGASGTATNTATVSGGGAPTATDVDPVSFGEPSRFDIVPSSYQADVFDDAYPLGSPARQAGDRPFEQRVNFDFTKKTGVSGVDGTRYITADGSIKTVEVTLPRGFVGNPEATPKCDPLDFSELGTLFNTTQCPADTQVGYLNSSVKEGTRRNGRGNSFNPNEILTGVPIYNLKPPKGVPADFGFNAGAFVLAHIYPNLDPAQNYAIKTLTPNISALLQVQGSEVT